MSESEWIWWGRAEKAMECTNQSNSLLFFFFPRDNSRGLVVQGPSLTLQTETEAKVFCDELSIIISSIACVEYQMMNLSPSEGPVMEPL